MKKLLLMVALLALAGLALAQVEKVAVQGVETTRAHTRGIGAIVNDGSVGEAAIKIVVTDAAGKPVAGAHVVWKVKNQKANTVYVVGTSAATGPMLIRVFEGQTVEVDGGVTNDDGEACIKLDSGARGDAKVYVTADGVEGKTYRGKDMRVVWF